MTNTKYSVIARWVVPMVRLFPLGPPEGWLPPQVPGALIVSANSRAVLYRFEREVAAAWQGLAVGEASSHVSHAMASVVPGGGSEELTLGHPDDHVEFEVWPAFSRAHGPAEPVKIRYPGGKDGWMQVRCLAPGCDYEATEALALRATKRVEAHAAAKNANEADGL